MTLIPGVQGNMTRLQKYKAIGYLIVLLNLMWLIPSVGGGELRNPSIFSYGSVISATVQNRSAAVRTGPSGRPV